MAEGEGGSTFYREDGNSTDIQNVDTFVSHKALHPVGQISYVFTHSMEQSSWSLTLREERKLRVFENMVLRRIFGPRRDEVTGEWRRLHNCILLCTPHPIFCA